MSATMCLIAAKDEEIFEWAHLHDAVIVTADSDFAMLLAIRRASKPSVVHIRDVADRPPAALRSICRPDAQRTR